MNLSSDEIAKREAEASKVQEDELDNEEELPLEEDDKKLLDEMRKVMEAEDDEEDEEEGDAEGMDVSQMNPERFKAQLLVQIVDFYQQEHGREPTKEEVLEGMKDVLRAMASGGLSEEEEGGNEENETEEKPQEKKEEATEKTDSENKKVAIPKDKENGKIVAGKRFLENAEEPCSKKTKLTTAE